MICVEPIPCPARRTVSRADQRAEIERLLALRFAVVPRNAFNESNREAIGAQVAVLEAVAVRPISEESVRSLPNVSEYAISEALDALRWASQSAPEGIPIPDAPHLSWQPLLTSR